MKRKSLDDVILGTGYIWMAISIVLCAVLLWARRPLTERIYWTTTLSVVLPGLLVATGVIWWRLRRR